jgi:hypothetical protein
MKLPVKLNSDLLRPGRCFRQYAAGPLRIREYYQRTLTQLPLVPVALTLAGLCACLLVGFAFKARSQRAPARNFHKQAVHKSPRPLLTGTDGSETGIADFLGNFTTITSPSQSYFLIQRQPDCSLTLFTGDSSAAGTATVTGTVPHYERTLHQLASLTTTDDVRERMCRDKHGYQHSPCFIHWDDECGKSHLRAGEGHGDRHREP